MSVVVQVKKTSDSRKWPVGSYVRVVRGGYGGTSIAIFDKKEDAGAYNSKQEALNSLRAQVIQPPEGVEFEFVENK